MGWRSDWAMQALAAALPRLCLPAIQRQTTTARLCPRSLAAVRTTQCAALSPPPPRAAHGPREARATC
eukprot:scaffold130654_cov31-Tisochrysis_lutea.AAC.5